MRLALILEGVSGGVARSAARALALGLGVLLLGPAVGLAKEVDSFTHRYEALAFPQGEVDGRVLSDFTDEFNAELQRLFAQILDELNEEGRRRGTGCAGRRARRRLFHRMSNRLGGPVIFADNRLRPAINRHPNRLRTRMGQSIYRDFAPWRSISLGLATKLGTELAAQFRFDLERTLVAAGGTVATGPGRQVRAIDPDGEVVARYSLRRREPAAIEHRGRTYHLLDGGQALVESAGEIQRLTPVLVSSDKFSHFFNRSLGLFKRLRGGSEADFDRVLARNYWLEASLFGSKSTGVSAFGDLVANFQGMRFWIHLLGQGMDGRPLPDPLAAGPVEPLVACSAKGEWVQRRPLDIRAYLDPAWDEALNCSQLRSRVLLRQVRRRIEGLDREDPLERSYSCPVDAPLIEETAAAYGRYADRVINPDGHSALRSRGR